MSNQKLDIFLRSYWCSICQWTFVEKCLTTFQTFFQTLAYMRLYLLLSLWF